MTDLTAAEWRKSSRSGEGECVEVASNLPQIVAIRDSKDTDGPAIVVPGVAWQAFVAGLRR